MEKNKFNNYNKKNTDDIPLTDIDYEGVVYEPSNKKPTYNSYYKNMKKNNNISPTKKIKKSQNFNYSYFLIGTISFGIIICLIVFSLTYSSISDYFSFPKSDVNNNIENNIINNNEDLSIIDNLNENTNKDVIGLIKSINLETNIVQLFSPTENKNYLLKIIGSSELKDQYEAPLLLVEFQIGDIVNFSFNSTNKIIYMKKSANSFYEKNISNYTIDTTNNLLNTNNKIYSLSKNLLVYKNLTELNLEDINNLDTLDIKGIDNTIYYIEIKKGNGTIKFINKPELTNATLEINRDIFKPLSESDTINLKEGVHKIVIRANSITPFVKEVSVFSGQETVVDLSEIQSKKGNLLIKTNVSDYTLYINNVVEPSREPLSLGYGAYSIRVEKEGYTPFETQVSINKPQTSIQIDLEKIEKLGQLSLSSSPTEAQVFIDNAFVGYTPLNYKLPYGTHNITLKKEGYLDFNLSSISIGKDESVFNITMHPNTSSTAETSTTETTQATTQANSEPVISE